MQTPRVLGGPTVQFALGGIRFLTDPAFDQPGDYPRPGGHVLTKTAAPAAGPEEIGPVDVVLLSHDQHPDNLDTAGRAYLGRVPLVLTTPTGTQRLGGSARALAPWESTALSRPDGGTLTVTAVPAQHGPDGCEPVTGEVTGFVLTGDGLPTVYVSGDNASLAVVEEIAARFGPVDTAILYAGAARTALFDGALLTLDSPAAARAAQLLGARTVVVAHVDSWSHFTEGYADVEAAFAAAGIADRLIR
ncbi:MBL fold metallo-hydrolase [Hamadaea tsunoensis]|uniref:MBL fold metallo-hydrolase n=1 Tax=Hamadaea tsunoensis TaxID=53368 RepID=UPI00040F2ABE|nr:MBL fold metallo-hydrolase [Hamadaea tsunoensis]